MLLPVHSGAEAEDTLPAEDTEDVLLSEAAEATQAGATAEEEDDALNLKT